MSNRQAQPPRERALRATRAVTFSSMIFAACGTTPNGESPTDGGEGTLDTATGADATSDASTTDVRPPRDATSPPPSDTMLPPPPDGGPADASPTDATSTPDVSPPPPDVPRADTPTVDTGATCSEIRDEICPEQCSLETDADCCEVDEWCSWNPEWGCECAAEGPFAPPRF